MSAPTGPAGHNLNKPHNLIVWTAREEQAVPETWDPACYRERAKAWRDKATVLPDEDPEREVCLVLADGYDRLATLLEQRAGRSA